MTGERCSRNRAWFPLPVTMQEVPPLPARMLNGFVYCPRLAYLELVHAEWAESADTVEGRFAHRVADRPGRALPTPEEAGGGAHINARSLSLSSEAWGVTAALTEVVKHDEDHVLQTS
jgi:CRISPR-associated protein Cas1